MTLGESGSWSGDLHHFDRALCDVGDLEAVARGRAHDVEGGAMLAAEHASEGGLGRGDLTGDLAAFLEAGEGVEVRLHGEPYALRGYEHFAQG